MKLDVIVIGIVICDSVTERCETEAWGTGISQRGTRVESQHAQRVLVIVFSGTQDAFRHNLSTLHVRPTYRLVVDLACCSLEGNMVQ